MKTTNYIFVLSLFLVMVLPCFGLEYNITFVGSGASETVNSVVVENLSTGAKVTVPEGNSLRLTDNPSGINQIGANPEETIHVSQNSDGTSLISFYAKQAGAAQVEVFTFDGKKVAGVSQNLPPGNNSFHLSLAKGAYVARVSGSGYGYSAKFVNRNDAQNENSLTYAGTGIQKEKTVLKKAASATSGVTEMLYADGQRLIYKGISGNNSTLVVDVPDYDSEIEFLFEECKDGSGNYYTVVLIGTQLWMAEDLRTTKFSDGTDITSGTSDLWAYYTGPAYIKPETPSTVSFAPPTTFYNWYSANAGYDQTTGEPNGSRTIAPAGFKVPAKEDVYTGLATAVQEIAAEEDKFEGYLYALCSTTGWSEEAEKNSSYLTPGAAAWSVKDNNTTGFGIEPSGYFDGTWQQRNSASIWFSTQWTDATGEIVGFYGDRAYFIFYDTSKVVGQRIRCFKEIE